MDTSALRTHLHEQVEQFPPDVLIEIADFAAFVVRRRESGVAEWGDEQWQAFTLEQFFRDTDEDVEYSLNDAQEVYQP